MRANNLESLGLLAGGIAHDFNNQLSSIMLTADLLEHAADDPSQVRELAAEICRAVVNASRLTAQLLTFSKGGTPSRQTVSLEDLVRENVTFSLRGSATQVSFRFEDGLWHGDVDPGQIGQVIQNLVLNADQAMSKHGTLSIEARNLIVSEGRDIGRAGRYVELRITDTGPGIPEAFLGRIFDPYFTTKPEGHGLGLSICHSIMERHRGSIGVESTTGVGTTFILRFPPSEGPRQEPGAEEGVVSGSGRVLVVDDVTEIRVSIVRSLEALGYRVTATEGVEEAVEAVRAALDETSPYDVVVTDLTIPGTGGGLEVLQRVKALDPNVRVVVASGYANDPVIADPYAHGFDAKVTKPIRLRALSAVLASLLAQS